MKRARAIIKEITITENGQIKNIQIKLPKNAKRIIGIETDVLVVSEINEGAVFNNNNNSTL